MQRLRQFLGVGFFRIIKLDCAECLTKGLDRFSVAINLFFQPFFRGCTEPAFFIRFVVEESDRAECSVCLRAFEERFEFMQIRGLVFQIQNMCRDFVDETVFLKRLLSVSSQLKRLSGPLLSEISAKTEPGPTAAS